jgi:hypothetical protein
MKTYLIGYDLNKAGQDYTALIEKIKTVGDWWHYLDSTWIVKTNMTAVAIANFLEPFMDSNDELLVVALLGESAWFGFNDEGSNWLKSNIMPT